VGSKKEYPWFSAYAKDMRMLRIEENNDLMEAINILLAPNM